MNDEQIYFSDNPSVETQVYTMARAINRLVLESRATSEAVTEIRILQREQNGNVASAMNRLGRLEDRVENNEIKIAKHDEWHGKEDAKIAERLAKTTGRHEVLVTEWKIVVGVLSSGVVGALAGKVGNLIGWW